MSLLHISPECKEREIRKKNRRKDRLLKRARLLKHVVEKRLEEIALIDEEIKVLRGEGDL